MEDNGQTSWRPLTLLAAVMAAVMFVFPLAIHFPLLDPDEGLHASIAQEMVERGDWITPHFLGRPFLDKPIFYFWVQAASLRLLGANETAVRLPGLMFGLLGAVTTGLLAWRMFGRATGLIAGILYATTILPTALAQAASHDVALVPWVNLTILLLWESSRHTPCALGPEGRRHAERACYCWCVLGAGFFLGLSILTKGLMGVAVVGLAYGGYVLCRCLSTRTASDDTNPCPISGPLSLWERVRVRAGREENPTFSSPIDTALTPAPLLNGEGTCCLRFGLVCGGVLLVAVLVAAPWYLAVEAQNPGFFRYYFLDRHLLGLASDTQPHSDQPWWYYLPVLLGGGLPWIGYLSFRGVRGQGSGAGVRKSEIRNPKSEIRNSSVPRPSLVVLADRLDGVPDAGTIQTGDLPLAGLSAAGDLGGPGLGEVLAERVGQLRHPSVRKLDLSFSALATPPGDLSRGLSSGRLGAGRSCCRRRCWRCSGSTRCGSRGRFGWQSAWRRRFALADHAVACGPAARQSGGGGALAGCTIRGGDGLGAPAGGQRVLRPRVGRAFQPSGKASAAAVDGRGADRLAGVLSHSPASRGLEGGPTSESAARSPAAVATGRRDRDPGAEPLAGRQVSRPRRCPYESVGRYRLYRIASPAGGRHSCLPERMLQPGRRECLPHRASHAYDAANALPSRSNHTGSRPTCSRNIATRQPAAAPMSTSLG